MFAGTKVRVGWKIEKDAFCGFNIVWHVKTKANFLDHYFDIYWNGCRLIICTKQKLNFKCVKGDFHKGMKKLHAIHCILENIPVTMFNELSKVQWKFCALWHKNLLSTFLLRCNDNSIDWASKITIMADYLHPSVT